LADCLIYLCAIANRYGIDLEAAFRAKEAKNRERTWKVEQ
jgi:NTP pyrophosphatase (non-canonical NTP hydrolase)